MIMMITYVMMMRDDVLSFVLFLIALITYHAVLWSNYVVQVLKTLVKSGCAGTIVAGAVFRRSL